MLFRSCDKGCSAHQRRRSTVLVGLAIGLENDEVRSNRQRSAVRAGAIPADRDVGGCVNHRSPAVEQSSRFSIQSHGGVPMSGPAFRICTCR